MCSQNKPSGSVGRQSRRSLPVAGFCQRRRSRSQKPVADSRRVVVISRRRRRRRLIGNGIPYVPAVSMECPTNYDSCGFSFGLFGIRKTTTTTNAKKAFLMFCKWLELDESVFAELISRQNHFPVLAHSARPLFARRLKQGRVA